jgi:hypothetical protein
MSVVVYNQPASYGLAYNDNAYVFRSTNYTATQRFKVLILPSDYPSSPILATVRVFPRVGVDVNGVVTTDRAYYDPSRILANAISGQRSYSDHIAPYPIRVSEYALRLFPIYPRGRQG